MTSKKVSRGKSPSSIKRENRSVILNMIRQVRGISRAELAKATGLSKGGLTPIINELMELGMIYETETSHSGSGRKPVGLKLNGDCCRVVSVDWSRSRIIAACVSFAGEIVSMDRHTIAVGDTQDGLLVKISEMVKRLVETASASTVVGIGVVVPGPIDYENGIILMPPNFYGWSNIPVRTFLEEATGLPVHIDNNAHAHALAEKNLGYGREYNSFIHVVVDEGIGGGIIIDNALFRGNYGLGGEFGHITLDMNGPLCECGNHGCAELYATIPGMLESANRRLKQAFLEDAYQGPLDLTWKDFLDLMERGNRICEGVMQKEAYYLGNLFITLANIFEPQAIVIGSHLAMAGESITGPVNAYMQNRTMAAANVPVLTSKLQYPSFLGGAAAVLDQFIMGELGSYEKILSLKKYNINERGSLL